MKLYLGIFLLIAASLIPLLGLWVANLPLPVAAKGTIIGLLTVGGPEVLAMMAVALLGKEAFRSITEKLLSSLGRLAPKGSVSRTRYKCGLALFLASSLAPWAMGYASHFLAWGTEPVLYLNIGSDLLFVFSLFVLGGDFWDKLKALFVYDARADFVHRSSD